MENVQDTEIQEEPVEQTEIEEKQEIPQPGDIEYTNKVKRRIGKVTAKYHSVLEENKKLKEQLKGSGEPKMPSLKTFVDETGEVNYEDYDKAMGQYHKDFYNWREGQKEEPEDHYNERLQLFDEQVANLSEQYPDVYEVVSDENKVFSPMLADAILDSENSGILAYHIGKNKALAMRLNKITQNSPETIMEELEKIEKTFQKKSSSAPPPINPVEPEVGTVEKTPKNDQEWFEKEEKKRFDKLKRQLE
jgi:hypothetical protein